MKLAVHGINLIPLKTELQRKQELNSNNYAENQKELCSKFASNSIKNNAINCAKTIKFTGALIGAFAQLNNAMVTCKTESSNGENVGSAANINKLLHDFAGEFAQPDDAIKTTIKVGDKKVDGKELPVFARTQIKLIEPSKIEGSQDLLFEMAVRQPSKEGILGSKCDKLSQLIGIKMTPTNYKGEGTKEQAYILNTKGNLMAVVEDKKDVLLTNAGKIRKKDSSKGSLAIRAEQNQNTYKPFTTSVQEVKERQPMPSIGEGTEIIIGMENGRFEKEIKDSIKTFVDKVKSGEIVLNQFVANPNAKSTQLIMLAGGFASRAEYTNASSSAIFHDKLGGSQSTKGVFRTATGLTPMETTFVTLHNAGLLDCSKDVVDINKNIKFYLNKGQNRGNGEFSADLYQTMKRDGRKSAMIFANDSISRMTNAVIEAKNIMDSGKAAIVLIAKKVKAQECVNTFGIMKYDPETRIIEGFKEKPAQIPEGYADKDGMCVTNAFQFAVSDEAFKVLDMFEDYFVTKPGKKETRDWSKQYLLIIKLLSEENDIQKLKTGLADLLDNKPENIPDELIQKAKDTLGNQKIYAVPTNEPWADCGTLNQLYQTTMQIVNGDFPLEDFERAHAQSCVDTQTGLVTSSPEQLKRIQSKYATEGQVMVVPQAKKITLKSVSDVPVTVHND